MIGIGVDPNSIHIRMVSVGCCKSRFNSNYPARLNGIISQDEFQESMGNINRNYPSKKIPIITAVIVALCLICGITLLVVGLKSSPSSRPSGYSVLWAIGVAFIALAAILLLCGCIVNGVRRTKRMRKAIAEESKKYSTRSPTACTWQLLAFTVSNGYGRSRTTRLIYHIIIHIRQHGAFENNNARFNSNQYAPPAYSGQSAAFCSQCGVPRQNLTAKFCPSCGQPFDKY